MGVFTEFELKGVRKFEFVFLVRGDLISGLVIIDNYDNFCNFYLSISNILGLSTVYFFKLFINIYSGGGC